MLIDNSQYQDQPSAAQKVEEDLLRVQAELHWKLFVARIARDRVAAELIPCNNIPQVIQLLMAQVNSRRTMIQKPLLMSRDELQTLPTGIEIYELQITMDKDWIKQLPEFPLHPPQCGVSDIAMHADPSTRLVHTAGLMPFPPAYLRDPPHGAPQLCTSGQDRHP